MPRHIVIGAGISGLATACCLARSGQHVRVLEKNATVGGRARAFESNGFFFDMGPSWYWMPDIFEQFFSLFGKSSADYYKLVRLDPGFRIFYKGQDVLDVPANALELERLFEGIEPGSSRQLKRYLEDAELKYREGMLQLAYQPSLSLREFMSVSLLSKVFRLSLFRSGRKHIARYFKDPRLIQLMEFPMLFLGAMPDRIPALYSLMNYAALRQGTLYPMGGMHEITRALQQLAVSMGVELHTGHEVKEVQISGGRISSLITGAGIYSADSFVAAGDYAHMESLLDANHRNYDSRYWKKKTFAPSCLLFYIGVNCRVPGLLHHNLFFDSDFDRHAQQIYKNPEWPADPLFYVCAPSKTDPNVAPQGCENLFLLIPTATGLADNTEVHERCYELAMQRLEERCGIPVRQHVIYRRVYSGDDFKADYHSYGGNAYGLANTLRQTAFMKPRMINKHISNLIYTGQLTVPGPGLPPSLISGQIAANLAMQRIQQNRSV